MTAWHPVELRLDAGEAELQTARIAGYDVLFLQSEGAWRAYDDECPHVGCRLSEDGQLEAGVLTCVCHGAEFAAASGALLEGPAETPLVPYPLRVVEGRLEVQL